MNSQAPNYRRIYTDIISKKHPDKEFDCRSILKKEQLTTIDIIRLNEIIFKTDKKTEDFNQKHRSYDIDSIKDILEYQVKNKLSNTQVAFHFKMSRNTISKWKKLYL
ncbi:helix-turn-helix domain-containing protein [Chryseobacterium sp. CBSDS_008]|uniref:helix-turn-helix domain-containing protein n=1 Tax=Chryseobacterium sp. CBSDS_008 TaxID=3415265 RepID=UPI003CF712D5